ncbi:mRNA surveillance protein pelota [Halosimplex aquaticum]|uniref:Protein pelota homolog n=1 Tax=Halosimplex aquaticum TaxID=3026162 RepID=A0ABD5Y3Y0_9EURY|nr:mRNA surveillance protein pelota [Halosimplex aquaticum]
MQINDRHHTTEGRERVTLVPESLDDLWHLTYVVEPGDLVAGDTTRRIQRNDDDMRDTGGEREPMWIEVEVDDVEFAKFANRLRVGGVIVDCSREDQLDFHHTLNVEPLTEIEVEKVWKPDQDERLAEAVEATENPDVAIATVEEGQAYVHTVAQYGTEERASLTGSSGKGQSTLTGSMGSSGGGSSREDLYEELTAVLARMDVDAVILAGPGFTKQQALDYIEDNDPDLASLITTVDTAGVGDRGVHEVLKRGAVDEVQTQTRISKEADLVDELTERIAKGTEVAYGPERVAEAAEFGAIETLLILDERLRAERGDEGEWEIDVDDVIETTEQKGGEVTVFSGEFDPGQQLRNLGGIAALLRYRID